MRRDAQPDRREILRLHALGEHPQVVGVGFELVLYGACGQPRKLASTRSISMLAPFTTRIVTGAPPRCHALAGPLVDPLLRGERIGDVGLQRDAGRALARAPADRASA